MFQAQINRQKKEHLVPVQPQLKFDLLIKTMSALKKPHEYRAPTFLGHTICGHGHKHIYFKFLVD